MHRWRSPRRRRSAARRCPIPPRRRCLSSTPCELPTSGSPRRGFSTALPRAFTNRPGSMKRWPLMLSPAVIAADVRGTCSRKASPDQFRDGYRLSGVLDLAKFARHPFGGLGGAKYRGDRSVGHRRVDPVGNEYVEGFDAFVVEGQVGLNRSLPRRSSAVGGELHQESGESTSRRSTGCAAAPSCRAGSAAHSAARRGSSTEWSVPAQPIRRCPTMRPRPRRCGPRPSHRLRAPAGTRRSTARRCLHRPQSPIAVRRQCARRPPSRTSYLNFGSYCHGGVDGRVSACSSRTTRRSLVVAIRQRGLRLALNAGISPCRWQPVRSSWPAASWRRPAVGGQSRPSCAAGSARCSRALPAARRPQWVALGLQPRLQRRHVFGGVGTVVTAQLRHRSTVRGTTRPRSGAQPLQQNVVPRLVVGHRPGAGMRIFVQRQRFIGLIACRREVCHHACAADACDQASCRPVGPPVDR